MPNMFPEGEREGLYHTADATLWYFHAIERYVRRHRRSRDPAAAASRRSSTSSSIICEGTRFGIRVDPADGLLRQGAEGYQLTWMDAKVDDWVVTPRRGKAVEINALWYNALRLLARLAASTRGDDARGHTREHAQRARESFNERFWNPDRGYLYDVIDGPRTATTRHAGRTRCSRFR